MHEYVSYMFQLVRQDGALAIAVVVLVLAAAAVVCAVSRRQGRAFPWKRAAVLALLAGYLAALCSMTLTGREAFGAATNFHWFRAWREAWNSFSVKNWLLVLLNVAAFVPLGLLLPLAFRPFRRWYLTVPAGFLTSLAIEALQLATGRGTFDVDDLFTNTLGCALGYCLVMAVLLLHARQTARRWLPYLACPAAFCLAIGGIFAAYALKPYGNLSCAPSYRADLSEVSWTLACDLTEDAGTAMVYRTESLTKESCEDFAAAFAQKAGIAFTDAYYYDDMTYFANHSSGDTLSVDYRDSSYTYRLGTPLAVSEGSEAELRGAARPAWNRGARGRGIFPGGSGHFPIYGGLSPRGRCNLWRGAPLPCGGRIAGAGGKPPAGADAPAGGAAPSQGGGLCAHDQRRIRRRRHLFLPPAPGGHGDGLHHHLPVRHQGILPAGVLLHSDARRSTLRRGADSGAQIATSKYAEKPPLRKCCVHPQGR